ncbi:Acyl-CoA N-acyltransferase [Macrophomina phaseolina MS6]|uniref:Acyl-CoA N-acyltransferase n=1 Tax=Macrophomina phaseolina (strain MS6) TaxID=1126212 RepID=K2S8A0_MACPH|nr:Acyl-CoA N-acyltransferase [Macrophomina phaseolina MS6]
MPADVEPTPTSSQLKLPLQLKLPHPWLTTYVIEVGAYDDGLKQYRIQPAKDQPSNARPLPQQIHHEGLTWSELRNDDTSDLQDSDNSSWARARRTPSTTVRWTGSRPTVQQLWLVAYALVTLHHRAESLRLVLSGPHWQDVGRELMRVGLLLEHPRAGEFPPPTAQFLLFAGMFWQGAASPAGPRPIWLAESALEIEAQFPPVPFQQAPVTVSFAQAPRHTQHLVRPRKPTPGSTIYSRYIPHLGEHFSMVALDYEDPQHLNLFHVWQNDPRVAEGWNETGTLDQHRAYLKNLHDDPHVLTILARFDDVFFAYYEVYWAKEDHMGAHYPAGDFDRGRHSLVGDTRFRGPHRVSAWWSGIMHYMFLDEPRTESLVGEPKCVNSTVLAYDFAHGFHVMRLVDLPHKRSAFVRCPREKFFQICPLSWDGERVVSPSLDRLAKL